MSHSGSVEKQEPQGNTAALWTWPADSQAAPAEGNMGAAPSVEIPGGGQEGYNVLKVRARFKEQRVNIGGGGGNGCGRRATGTGETRRGVNLYA